MDNKRYLWYKNEIARLKEVDKKITNKVRASYSISEPNKPNDIKLKKALSILFKDND